MDETRSFRWLRRIGLLVLCLIVGIPLWVVVVTSATPLSDVGKAFAWLPRTVTLTPYVDMWTTIPLARYLGNSAIVAVAATVLAMVVAVPAAYVLARSSGRAVRAFGVMLIGTQAMPGTLLLLPLFLIFTQLERLSGFGLIGSYPGLVLIDLTFALPLAIWMMSVHFAALPRDVEEAARMDGAGTLHLLVRIVLPMAAPGIAAAAVFAFVVAWGEVLFATIITDERTRTLPVGLHGYATQSTVYWNQLAAAALISSLPAVVGFIAARRYLVRDLAAIA
jgi:multiple sugar transport system permease protein